MLTRILGALGLARQARLEAALEQANRAQRRHDELARALEDARADARAWKARAEEAQARAGALRDEVGRQAAEMAQLRKAAARADTLVEREDQRDRELVAMGERVAAAERELARAREQLMLADVKLDILEGAAHVLDGRTRAMHAKPQP